MWQEYLERQLEKAKNPVVLSSWGKDSLLLLYSLSRMDRNLPVVWFGGKLSIRGKRVIQELGLSVYSWPAIDRYLIPNGNGLSLVSEYMIGNRRMPSITDIEVNENGLDLQSAKRIATELQTTAFPFPWDIVLWGYKQCDQHPLLATEFEQEIQFGTTRLISPLYDLTDEEVLAALDELSVDYDPNFSDDIQIRPEVFAAIESMEWDRDHSLSTFRQRFGLPC